MKTAPALPPVPTLPELTPAAVALLSTYPEGLHPDVARVCAFHAIPAAQIRRRYSDAQILCTSHSVAHAIKSAGVWRSSSEVFRLNVEHPDAKAFPYGAEIGLAFLSAILAKQVPNDSGD